MTDSRESAVYDVEEVIRLARRAGDAIMAVYEGRTDVELKSDGSPITAADRLSHDVIVAGLSGLDPRIPIVSEEGASVPFEERKRWKSFWLVDPLDGTKEFIKRNGEFTVNIALIDESKPVLGVIYAPARATLYFAELHTGAYKRTDAGGTVPIHVDGNRNGGLTVVRSRSHASKEEDEFLSRFDVSAFTSVGSSLKFCLVAEGAAHLYYRHGHTWEWDTAAGHAIAEIAGGFVRGLRYGKPELLNDGFLCASFAIDPDPAQASIT